MLKPNEIQTEAVLLCRRGEKVLCLRACLENPQDGLSCRWITWFVGSSLTAE